MNTIEKTKWTGSNTSVFNDEISHADEEIAHILGLEDERQSRKLIMIASESECPAPVRMTLASTFTNIYAEGYPSRRLLRETGEHLPDLADQLSYLRRYSDRRYYKGVEYADVVESLACRRAAALFATDAIKAENIFVNVQPLSGAAANNAVYEAFVKPGETVLGMDLTHGGHLTHGSHANRSGKNYNIVSYHADYETGDINYKEVEELAHKHRPKMIIAGYSAYPRLIDWKRFREIATSVGAILLADMSHIAGLVAGKCFPSPVGFADVISFTTHKTLCGPRGAAILTTNEEYGKMIDTAVFPGEQGGPHLNAIAAKAVLFKIANTENFANLQKQVLSNSKTLASTFSKLGLKLAYGGTDSHMVLVDLRDLKGTHGFNLRGEIASRILDMCGITCNKNTIPGDTSAVHPGALRFGTTWITQRGFREKHTEELANIIYTALKEMRPYKYLESSGDVGRAKIPLGVLDKLTEQVQSLIKETDAQRVMPQSEYPFWMSPEKTGTRKSPLYNLHVANKYKIETIHGYELPLYCESPSEGSLADSALTDACNTGILEIRGDRASYFLDEVMVSRISALKTGESTTTFIMENSGKVVDTVFVGRTAENKFTVVTSAITREKIISLLRSLADGYVVFDETDIYAKIQGPAVVDDMTNTLEKRNLLTNIQIIGENAALALTNAGIKVEKATITRNSINGADTLILACLTGSTCSLMVHPDKAETVWSELIKRGFKPSGYSGIERIKEEYGLPLYKDEVDGFEMYQTYPGIFDMGKPYFMGQKYLNGKIEKPAAKKSFKYQEQETELKKTCLYDEHIKLGGRMAPFAGFSMPVWYTTINDEHLAVRTAAGLFDVSHMGIISIEGSDSCRFIDTITSNYALRMLKGQSQYSYLLDADGNILDDIMVYRRDTHKFMVVVNAANAAKVNAWLNALISNEYTVDSECMHKNIKFNVTIKDLKDQKYGDECLVDLALQGPNSWIIISNLLANGENLKFLRLNRNEFIETEIKGKKVIVSRTGYTGEDYGYELYLNPKDAPFIWKLLLDSGKELGVKACGLGSRDSTRTEAGLPLYGHELEGPYNVDPIEAGYGPFVKFHKPFFIGRKTVVEKEKNSKMQIIRFKMLNKGIRVVKQGCPITTKRGDAIGYVTSCVIIDGMQYGLAYVNKRYTEPETKISVFILPPGKTSEKQKDELQPGDKVMLPEDAVILKRFPAKGEFTETYSPKANL